MDQNDRRIIDDLFAKLAEAERQAPPRDAQADAYVHERLQRQPHAPRADAAGGTGAESWRRQVGA